MWEKILKIMILWSVVINMLLALLKTDTDIIAFWSLEARSSLNCRPTLCLGHPKIISSRTLSAMKNLHQFIILDTSSDIQRHNYPSSPCKLSRKICLQIWQIDTRYHKQLSSDQHKRMVTKENLKNRILLNSWQPGI